MILYTFRTFPRLELLHRIAGNVFVFGKLKQDVHILKQRIIEERPDYLIGVALTKGPSRIEPTAVNKFNSGNIIKGGALQINLHVPSNSPFPLAKSPTHTFCNWTMYRLQGFLNDEKVDTKLVFVHLNIKDFDDFSSLVQGVEDFNSYEKHPTSQSGINT